jgi:ferritin
MDFTPINNYSNAMKKMLPKSGIERLQSEAIYQMLTNENAIEIYVNGSYRFYDKQMDDLCNYLIDYYDKKNPLDASSFISYLTENAGEEKSKLINVVTELIATSHPPFNEESMKEMLDILKEKVDKITKSNKLTRKMQGKTPEEQAQIVQKDIIDANKDKKRRLIWEERKKLMKN